MNSNPNIRPLEQVKRASREEEKSPAEKIIDFVTADGAELFHTADKQPFLRIRVQGHWETLPMAKKSGFRGWLGKLYYDRTGQAASESAISEAVCVLVARATYDGSEEQVWVRLGEHRGCIYVDLGDDTWDAVKITMQDWEIVSDVPIRFRRPAGMQALPRPVGGGSIEHLRPLINVADDGQWVLILAWLVSSLRPTGPYLVLVLQGTHGSAKSTVARVLRLLVDPNLASARSIPKDIRDLMISAKNGWCLSFDNLSGIPGWISDALCRLATGGGYATRRNYTDDEEALFDATRPIILNGIDAGVTRGDLLDRSILLDLPQIESCNRRTEEEFWRCFEQVRPAVLGALLTTVSVALRRLPEVRLTDLPRMADIAKWITAAEESFGMAPGTMLAAYNRNRLSSNELTLEDSPLVDAIEDLTGKGPWTGTASKLLPALMATASDQGEQTTEGWPVNPSRLSAELRRLAPNLRAIGIAVEFGKTAGARSKRIITLTRVQAA